MPTVVFVHGALVTDAPWWWGRMGAPLRERGLETLAVGLPSCGEGAAATPGPAGMHADAAAVRAALDAVAGPVLLVGHSYGGAVITEAGTHPAVAHLAYVSSVMPDAGQAHADVAGGAPPPWLRAHDDGTVSLDPAVLRELFAQDCDSEAVEGARARLTRQQAVAFAEPVTEPAWRTTPATALICVEDRAVPAAAQRAFARPGTPQVDLPTGHHPMLNAPDVLAGALAALL